MDFNTKNLFLEMDREDQMEIITAIIACIMEKGSIFIKGMKEGGKVFLKETWTQEET
jgi:hypothetical protein